MKYRLDLICIEVISQNFKGLAQHNAHIHAKIKLMKKKVNLTDLS